MCKKFFLIVFLLSSLATINYGQSNKKKNKTQPTKQDNAFSPSSESSTVAAPTKKIKKSKKKRGFEQYEITMEQKVKEFEERMEANAKAYKKQHKEMQKPQYSDPSYFGHKRKPKIRKAGKRKFCKECGIVH